MGSLRPEPEGCDLVAENSMSKIERKSNLKVLRTPDEEKNSVPSNVLITSEFSIVSGTLDNNMIRHQSIVIITAINVFSIVIVFSI